MDISVAYGDLLLVTHGDFMIALITDIAQKIKLPDAKLKEHALKACAVLHSSWSAPRLISDVIFKDTGIRVELERLIPILDQLVAERKLEFPVDRVNFSVKLYRLVSHTPVIESPALSVLPVAEEIHPVIHTLNDQEVMEMPSTCGCIGVFHTKDCEYWQDLIQRQKEKKAEHEKKIAEQAAGGFDKLAEAAKAWASNLVRDDCTIELANAPTFEVKKEMEEIETGVTHVKVSMIIPLKLIPKV